MTTPDNHTPSETPKSPDERETTPIHNHGQWEVGVPDIFFNCTHAVFPKGGNNSLFYTTSEERAQTFKAWLDDGFRFRLKLIEANSKLARAERDLAAKSEALAQVTKERDEERKDSERLDWLERQANITIWECLSFRWSIQHDSPTTKDVNKAETLREAIDYAARKEQP